MRPQQHNHNLECNYSIGRDVFSLVHTIIALKIEQGREYLKKILMKSFHI